MREAARSSAPRARIAAFCPSPTTWFAGTLRAGTTTAAISSMGVYPMLQDETCFFLAADFDKTHWQEDAAAFLETCRRMDLPAALERSRSGNGGHVWLFFAEAIPAALARRLGSHILTETMERRPDIGLDSYDRFFPNQDTLPQGGFGNLIALPLQKQPRELGNSVFLDEQCLPYPDQWAFLSGVAQDRSLHRRGDRARCRAARTHRRRPHGPAGRGGCRALGRPPPSPPRRNLRSPGRCPRALN